jgi:hypothetical protein
VSSEHFDLQSVAAAYDSASIRPRRIMMGAFAGIGAVMAIFGGAANLNWPDKLTSQGVFGAELLLGLGLLILLVAGIFYRRLPQAAKRLDVGPDGIHLVRLDGVELSASWANSRTRITIYDWRSVPSAARGRGLWGVDFVLTVGLPVEASVPLQAVEAIMSEAERHGYTVEGWERQPRTSARGGLIRIAPRKAPRKPV